MGFVWKPSFQTVLWHFSTLRDVCFWPQLTSTPFAVWRPSLAIGFGSSTSSTSRWRMKPQKRFNQHKDWAQIHFLFILDLVRTSSLNNHQFLSSQQGGVGVWVTGVYIVVVLPVLLFYRYFFLFLYLVLCIYIMFFLFCISIHFSAHENHLNRQFSIKKLL